MEGFKMVNWILPCVDVIKAAKKHPGPADFEAVYKEIREADAHKTTPQQYLPYSSLGERLVDALCEFKYAKPFMKALHAYLAAADQVKADRLFSAKNALDALALPDNPAKTKKPGI